MTEKKNWFRKHWILSSILGFILLLIGLGMFSTDSSNDIQSNSQISNEEKEQPSSLVEENKNEISLINDDETSQIEEKENEELILNTDDKTEGYTLNDCLNICDEAYDIQMQVNVCQNNCYMFGKPSDTMDKYVNTVKDIRDRNN